MKSQKQNWFLLASLALLVDHKPSELLKRFGLLAGTSRKLLIFEHGFEQNADLDDLIEKTSEDEMSAIHIMVTAKWANDVVRAVNAGCVWITREDIFLDQNDEYLPNWFDVQNTDDENVYSIAVGHLKFLVDAHN